MNLLDERARRLVLACEIAGYLHDLGKLHPGFAAEKLDRETEEKERLSTGIGQAHGRILEDGRNYPHTGEIADKPALRTVLDRLRTDPAWANALALPEKWILRETVQATGLGMALRQHHATEKFPDEELALLGDLYAFGADVRDSALDKGSGGTTSSKQTLAGAEIVDAFGHTRSSYSPEWLAAHWDDAITALNDILFQPDATADIVATRSRLYEKLAACFTNALGETRRPTHDVTLHHHAFSTASFFKAAVAEGALRQDFSRWQDGKGLFNLARLGDVRFRLLGIRWDWSGMTRNMLSAVAVSSLHSRRHDAIERLRTLFSEQAAVGNLIYEDDDGVLLLLPGFHDANPAESEKRFVEHVLDPLMVDINEALRPLGTGTAYRLCWTAPTLYLTDYAEALGVVENTPRLHHCQVDETGLRALWNSTNAKAEQNTQICPQCGLRPAQAKELSLTESKLKAQALCEECSDLADRDARRERIGVLAQTFGFRPQLFDMEELAKAAGSPRVALVSVRVDAAAIATGNALITQLARPVGLLKAAGDVGLNDANSLGDWFESLLTEIRAGQTIDERRAKLAGDLLGDRFWLKSSDGRGSPLEVAESFFLHESSALSAELKLVRHDGDRLALFAMRKHASPARLQRLWDDLRDLWRNLVAGLASEFADNLIPLTLDAGGVRIAVAATDADAAVRRAHSALSQRLGRLRGGFAPHVSCVVTRPRFPLHVALDCLYRLEQRVSAVPTQAWTVVRTHSDVSSGAVLIDWNTPQGPVRWSVPNATADPAQPDLWHPHVIVSHRSGREIEGPIRLTHVDQLSGGDVVQIPPATLDFVVLEGSARRHQLAYRRHGEALRRPHWVMGASGRAPLLLDGFDEFTRLLADARWDVGKAKRLQGEMVETYEKWVRDVPDTLRENGRQAWLAHLRNMLLRYHAGSPAQRETLLAAINDGRFFDAVEWTSFVSKSSNAAIHREATA